jgi:hypothetical protein
MKLTKSVTKNEFEMLDLQKYFSQDFQPLERENHRMVPDS